MRLLDKPYTEQEKDCDIQSLRGNICRICVSDSPEEIISMVGFANDCIAMLAYSRIKSLEKSECYGCSYFEHDGHCSATEDIHDCEYCKTAFTDKCLTEENDLSYLPVGKSANGFSAFIGSSAMCRPPVEIVVQQWNEQHQRNQDIFRFTPKYCPICGRRITENDPYLHLKDEKTKNNV